MDNNGMFFSLNNNFGDTTLRLDCFGYGEEGGVFASKENDDGCRLVLGLGPTPSTYSSDYSPIGGSKSKGQIFSSERDSILKLSLSGSTDELSVSDVFEHSVSNRVRIPILDEGSTSAKRSGGYMPSLLLAPRREKSKFFLEIDGDSNGHVSQVSSEPSAVSDYSMGAISDPTGGAKSSSSLKRCKFDGCTKGARGATGLCIGHGGGQRCQKPGCNKGAESRTAYCKAHGGGKRCQHLGCTKSAEGKTEHCIAHGGGKRCQFGAGCAKAARGKSGLCIKHGGGKRCKIDGCSRSAEGQIGLCISHGGGRRCQIQGCNKGAQGSTLFCKAHGGGKRCIFAGCTKGAEGSTPLCKAHGGGKRCMFDGGGICPKSVHGGTSFCVAHGGGKRCSIPGCTKSARGRTDCCVKHGGGKRCKIENCGKSAQGSTDFCKAHGGGKRCNWGDGKCEKFARGKDGLCAAHSSLVNGRDKNKGGMIGPGLFHGLVPTVSNGATRSLSGVSVISDTVDYSSEKPAKRQQLIPHQVLVPLSMKVSSVPYSSQEERSRGGGGGDGGSGGGGFDFEIPEGRVHGGGLMSLLGGNMKNVFNGI